MSSIHWTEGAYDTSTRGTDQQGPIPVKRLARYLLTKSNGLAFSPECASVGKCHMSTYHRRLLSNEWMTFVPTVSKHVFPLANEYFTRGKSPLAQAVNGLSDPKPDPIA